MVVAGNLGAGLIGHGNAMGLPRLGHSFQSHSDWMAFNKNSTIQACHPMFICHFYIISTESPRAAQSDCFGYDKELAGYTLLLDAPFTIVWHKTLLHYLTDMRDI